MSPTRVMVHSKTALPTRRLLPSGLLVVAGLGAALAGAITGVARMSTGHLPGGMHVGSLNVGGKTAQDARAEVDQLLKRLKTTRVVLRFAPESGIRRTWKLRACDLGLSADPTEALAALEKAGEEGPIGQVTRLLSAARADNLRLPPTADLVVLKAALRRIARRADRPPKKARLIVLAAGRFDYRAERSGKGIDVDSSAPVVIDAWNAFLGAPDADSKPTAPTERAEPTEPVAPRRDAVAADAAPLKPASRDSLDVTLPTRVTNAPVTVEDLKKVDGPLGSYTSFFTGTRNRHSNISLAAANIDGTVLAPDEVFSYNQTVGPRSAQAGFKQAHVIIKGRLVDGMGGGVCQVSSTLYNAVLLSDLKIVHRAHHAFPIGYLPAGRDATVAYGSIDFQFKNDTQTPIAIVGRARNGRLTFTVYGKRTPGKTVRISLAEHSVQPTTTEKVYDPTVTAGRKFLQDRGHRGERVAVYRTVKQNGVLVRRELISRDHYHPFPAILVVGTRPPKPPSAPTKPGATIPVGFSARMPPAGSPAGR